MSGKMVTVLVVDDDRVDKMAIMRSFNVLKIANPIIEASDGIEALQRLRGENGYKKVPSPFIILLDLNMPRMGGLEFLEHIRNDPVLQPAVIFVLTTSIAEEDRTRAYAKNIAGYLLKERPGQSFLEAIATLERYWKSIELPCVR